MLYRLLPRSADNNYRGHWLALWIFALVVLARTLISVNSIVNARMVATSADGLPLDAIGSAGAHIAISLFVIWGIAQLIISIVAAVVLIRYRALVPLMFLLLLLELAGRRIALHVLPIASNGSHSGSIVNLVLLVLLVIGLALSLIKREPRLPSALR